MDDINQDEKNISEIDMFVEAALKDFLEEILSYLEKYISSQDEIEEVEKKLYDYANLNELIQIIRNIFLYLSEKMDKKQISEVKVEMGGNEDYSKLEKVLQKHEGEIRNHISIEQQLRLCAENLQCKVEETEKSKETSLESSKQTINSLLKEKNELQQKLKATHAENEKLKKMILIKESKEKEILKKVEEYPFLQQKIKALETILKKKKQYVKYNSPDQSENANNISIKLENKKAKESSDAYSPLEKSRASIDSSKRERSKKNSFHQLSSAQTKRDENMNTFHDYLKMKVALAKQSSEKKESGKKTTGQDLKLTISHFPLFKLPKHPVLQKKEDKPSKSKILKPAKGPEEVILAENTVIQPGNVNINFTNLTNSLIVTQHEPNQMTFKKPRSEGQHRKTKSNGNVKNLVIFNNNNNKGFKTGVNFFEGKEKK